MLEIVGNVNDNKWHEFLLSHCNATLYHTPEWKTFLEKTFGYKPHYLFAIDESGQMTGMLPIFQVKSRLTRNRLCSVPFSHTCGPIGDSEAIYALLEYELNSFDIPGMNFIEIRDRVIHDNFEFQNSFSTFVLDLSVDLDKIWANLARDVRRGIRKSKKSGVKVLVTRNIEDLKTFYELNCITKRKIGVPAHPWYFFRNLFEILKDQIWLYLAVYNGECIGGGIREFYGNSVTAGYAASNPGFENLYPYNAINWKSIEDAQSKGFSFYDFGRVSYDNTGLLFYKTRWGTVEKKLDYSYYPRNPESFAMNRECLKYKLTTLLIPKMPMSVYKIFSDLVFGHFG